MNDESDHTTAISPFDKDSGKTIEPTQQAVLVVMTGPTTGQTIYLETKKEWTMGRSTEVDIVFQEASVSRRHAQLKLKGAQQWELHDLGSSNGTWINGEQIQGVKVLENGDRIQLGSSIVLKYVLQDEVEAAFQRELYESATKDALTGLYSKRYFMEQLEVEFNFHKRTQKPLSVVMADIDHFKHLNDTYGHVAGDHVLKELGGILLNILRKEDVGGRYGGEELIFLLRETSLPNARSFAERLRELIANQNFSFEGQKLQVTLSLGIATFTQENFRNPQELIKAADQYLYQAKKTGRNRSFSLIEK